MMVTFVSQCEKKALNRTRRVLDAFANRIGDNTWQTVITQEGLQAVKKLLRKTASKSTAVSCFWIRSRSHSEFIWSVGNKDKFNAEGIVPVNYTQKEIDQYMDKNQFQTLNVIQHAAAISALFHDFGKANILFQNKLEPKKNNKSEGTKSYEPYRHEWVSLRLFQAFVGNKTDEQWLDSLSQVERDEFPECFKDGLDGNVSNNHPIDNLQKSASLAKLVGWLILTHHKLPLYPTWKQKSPPKIKDVDQWFRSNFDAIWNSHNCNDQEENQEELIKQNWTFKKLPTESMQWRSKACMVASEARVNLQVWLQQENNWVDEQLFTTHLSRLCLILADHYYSSQEEVTNEWRNPNYKVYANTDRKTKELKQQLDEHLIGVAHHAQKIAKALPKFNATLRSLGNNDFLLGSVIKKDKEAFGWQDDAKKCAKELSKASIEQGFFGINMASTGKGKTLANAKIMVALSSETGRVRFSVALGLRTLTLQTGREYRDKLKLTNEDLAIAVGGTAVKQLFENEQNKCSDTKGQENQQGTGSESQEEFLDKDLYVDYTGDIYEHSLSEWMKKNEPLNKLIHAPVLVSTIDHLMPATEGTKGGKQIPAMLRLLSSDLVLDEPDDFGLDDLPALCRLVHWAGMLGSRVLLSTATMPPALAYALFQAYKTGWAEYAKANVANWDGEISCAWFDEDNCNSGQYKEFDSFKKAHDKFVKDRIKYLKANAKPQRKATIVTVEKGDKESEIRCMARVIQESIIALHKKHHQNQANKTISIGLVRMANITPLVAITKELLKSNVPEEDASIHYCLYHSRYPLAIRSHLENKLDEILNRKKPDEVWQQEEIKAKLQNHSQKNHIFVVLASPVAEVGRDHDYDWAIVEPSSMRSIIQLAGRVLRHRKHVPTEPNIVLLNKNFKALSNKDICFEKPGFESADLEMIKSHDLNEILNPEQYKEINSIQRITMQSEPPELSDDGELLNLVELEHEALMIKLFSDDSGAKLWWKNRPHWCGEMQRQQRFRDSKKDEAYYLCLNDENSSIYWQWKNENVFPPKLGELSGIEINDKVPIEFGRDSHFWFDLSAKTIYSELANDPDIDINDILEISHRFGEVRLIEYDKNKTEQYSYHENLGLHQEIGDKNE
ncbi:MAG TPA: type I-F CRISPR-associated helicase Cas3 [Candidatus Thioglobus autotrophicus]|nr:type I-F CRISPR-associated helicase Cas3 [Candidatus Thioglobus autotrophicus]